MNHALSKLSLTELCDQLSECTALYSRSMLNGLSQKEFTELQAMIEALQMEIAKRRKDKPNIGDNSQNQFPTQQSAGI